MCLDDVIDILEEYSIVILAAVAVIGGGAFVYYGGLDYLHFDNPLEPDTFELTTTQTDIGVGQDKYVVTEMAYTRILNQMTWTSSDSSVVTVEVPEGYPKNYAKITGVSEGTAKIIASSSGCTREISVTVTTDAPANQLKVYNMYSQSHRYAVVSGEGFENGVLSLAFNYSGLPVISVCGYTTTMLNKDNTNIGNTRYDFESVTMTLTDTTESTQSNYTWDDDDDYYSSPIFIPNKQFTVGHTYTIDFHVTMYNEVKYHITGTITYCSNDGSLDGTNVFTRAYAWKYDGKTFSFDLSFPYGFYSRYHTQNVDYITDDKTQTRNSVVAGYDETYFCHSNVITESIASRLITIYKQQYGNDAPVNGQKFADFVLGFVQICWTYEYDNHQYLFDEGKKTSDYWAFPMETIYSGIGDCEDTSILAATLFYECGYKAGIYDLPEHAMAAVHVDGYVAPSTKESQGIMCFTHTKSGVSYYGCESTYEYAYGVGVASSENANISTSELKLHLI